MSPLMSSFGLLFASVEVNNFAESENRIVKPKKKKKPDGVQT